MTCWVWPKQAGPTPNYLTSHKFRKAGGTAGGGRQQRLRALHFLHFAATQGKCEFYSARGRPSHFRIPNSTLSNGSRRFPKVIHLGCSGESLSQHKTDGGSLWGLSHHLASEKGEREGFSEYSYSSFSPTGKVIQPEVLTLPTLF